MRIFITVLIFIVGLLSGVMAQTGDSCDEAVPVEDLTTFCSGTGEYSLSGKSFSGLENPSCFPQETGEADVWFSFIPKFENINIVVRGYSRLEPGNSLLQPQMALYKGDCEEPELISCLSDNQAQNFIELIIGDLELGAKYFLRVSSRANHSGSFQLCLNNFQFSPEHSSDCIDATILCDKTPITVDIVSGVGKYPDEAQNTCLDTDPVTGRKDGPSEYASVWFKWIAEDDGMLTFSLDPLNPVDDLDFAVFELPGGINDCDRKIPIRCMASGENVGAPLEDWIACTGATGLREGETHTSEERGCQPGNTNFLAPLEMEKGKAYALMVNNYSQSGHGFRLTWGGDGEFAGPGAEMIFPDDKAIYCPGEEVVFYAEDVSVSGSITDYNWIYSDGGETRELEGSGIHRISFTSGGIKPIVLYLESDIGCVTYLDTVIEVEEPIEITATIDSITCNGYGDGRIEVDVVSESPVESMFWKNGAAEMILEDLDPGEYLFFVRNELGCMASDTFLLEEPPPIMISDVTTTAGCGGGRNGSIEVAGSGMYAPFLFDFKNGNGYSDRSKIENLSAGPYPVSVMDAAGCERDTVIFVNEIDYRISHEDLRQPACFEGTDGEIHLEVEGGAAPYQFDFDTTGNYEYNSRFTDLAAGEYVIAILDEEDCLGFHVAALGQPDSLTAETEQIPILCYGDRNGGAEIQVSGGTPGYQYLWDSGETGPRINGKGAGTYVVKITDENQCEKEVSVLLEQPPELELLLDEKRDLVCFGDRDGLISLVSSGGTGSHQYSFEQGDFSLKPRYQDLPAGHYSAVVRDENQCEVTLEVELTQPEEIIVRIEGGGGNPISSVPLGDKIDLEGHFSPPNRRMEWRWEPAEIFECPSCQTSELLPLRNTVIRLTGTDQDGCVAEDVLTLGVIPIRSVGIPNAVVKGNEGPNGFLTVYAGKHVSEIKELNVFDRWGNLLFSRKNFQPNEYLKGWDGTAQGRTLIPGTYVFMADILYLDGYMKTFSGEIFLIN